MSDNHSGDIIDEKKIVTTQVSNTLERLVIIGERFGRKKLAQWKNEYSRSYTHYLHHRLANARKVRNFIYDVESADLEAIYIGTRLRANSGIVTENDLIRQLDTSLDAEEEADLKARQWAKENATKAFHPAPTKRIAVRGIAGIGKSIFTKHLFVELTRSLQDKVPVLFELQFLNHSDETEFEDIILHELASFGGEIMKEQVVHGLQSGMFVILLDGFDEIQPKKSAVYERKLIEFSKRYLRCPIVVSGRPMDAMTSWSAFDIIDIEHLRRPDVLDLVSKLNFDETVKKSFVSELEKSLFESHNDFLGIPLHVTIMLLTYADVGQISERRHEFYSDAFSALWRKHDGKKGFTREFRSGLRKEDFLRLLHAISIVSYLQGIVKFREIQLDAVLKKSKELTGVGVDRDDYLYDLTTSVGVFLLDGNYFTYTHRTFQEYFVAKFIVSLSDEDCGRAIEAVSAMHETDQVLSFVISLDVEKFERTWVSGTINSLVKEIRRDAGAPQYYQAILDEYGPFMAVLRNVYGFAPSTQETTEAVEVAIEIDAERDFFVRGDTISEETIDTDIGLAAPDAAAEFYADLEWVHDVVHADKHNFFELQRKIANQSKSKASAFLDMLAK